MIFENSALSPQQFLDTYWQNEPLLLRQAFPGFSPALDADDIAGLACEELAQSRLVTGSFPQQDWRVHYGPFTEEDFAALPEADWTLLVQDVEKHYPPLQELLQQFRFLPRWRIDDLMVSVAGPGGSVGPHVDQYDVFLLQAQGRRRWQIAQEYDEGLLGDCELNVLRYFRAEEEWILEPGDLLYLPPGVAHHGVALEKGMTWSIGMRAPSAADLFQTFGDWLSGGADQGGRYRDGGLEAASRPGEIDARAIGRFRDFLLRGNIESEKFPAFLGAFLSGYRLAHEPAAPHARIDPAGLMESLLQGKRLRHNPWTRLLWIETKNGASLFAAGAEYSSTTRWAQIICDPNRLHRIDRVRSESGLDLLCELLNQGHLYLE